MVKEKYNIRYLQTKASWYAHKISEGFIKDKTVLLFIAVAVIAFLLYHISIPYNVSECFIKISKCVVTFFDIEHLYDETIKTSITTFISSLTIIISLLSAVYVFTHREQKSVSPSASTDNKKNGLVILVICLMIFNIVFGCLIVGEYNGLLSEKSYVISREITKSLYSRIIFLCLTLLVLITLIVELIKYLFKTMSIDDMLTDSVKQASKQFETLLYMDRSEEFNAFLECRYRKLHFSLESVFQNLKFAAEHNMNREFEENIEAFKAVITRMKETEDKYEIKHIATYLLNNDNSKFINAYNSALRSNLSLISSLMKNQQYNKANKAVLLYFHMFLDSDDKFKKVFKMSLNDFLDFMDTSDERQLLIFLEGLDKIPKDQTYITYKFLLMKLINKNQIKNLTNLVYDSKKYSEYPKLKGLTLGILLQNLIKSIEISNYNITGFLVKFLITNFSGQDLNRRLLVLKTNRHSNSSVLEANETIDGINENGVFAIKINDETFDYCFKKAFILLFAQHLYSVENNLWYTEKWNENGNEIKLNEEFQGCNYSKYIMDKIQAASSKYGLLAFQDEKVMKAVYKEIKLSYKKPNEKKENKILSETISFIVGKIMEK
ncbi:hypothetical protein ABEX53_04145 [Bacillus toyonensis]|uniref:hypothetical protein n=1 Tax=Bacillus toyonensis TaxID=155322 RepID=UPI001CA4B72A|nr:hypothetical protein [Bacillus toyonensis]MED3536221.1 hypothetical protein [Bacillus toyonensis]MEE2018264.1 hypothetical protein [Bacillus toyonensis]